MRVGQNPAKSIERVPQPEKVTVAVVTYIPFLSGYYAESLEVLKVCLGSIWNHTELPHDILVFDNASCSNARAFLSDAHRQGRIQYLVFSDKNVGKGGAWNFIFQAAPGEYIAYTDSDVYYSPGWLERSMEILDVFPNVGMVTSRPLRTPETYFSSTLEWARLTPEADLIQGQFLSWDVFKEHNDSLGVSAKLAQEWFENSHDWQIEYRGQSAYVGAAHFQFLAPKSVLQSLLPLKMDRPMGQVRSLDEKLNHAGYLRLTTCEPFVKHMGNRLGTQAASQPIRSNRVVGGIGKRLFKVPLIRRSLLWLYNQIFRLYYSEQ